MLAAVGVLDTKLLVVRGEAAAAVQAALQQLLHLMAPQILVVVEEAQNVSHHQQVEQVALVLLFSNTQSTLAQPLYLTPQLHL
jgi:hypothetical protein